MPEFNFAKGMLVATFCGFISARFCTGWRPARRSHRSRGRSCWRRTGSELWQNLPVLIVVLAGGFITNLVCWRTPQCLPESHRHTQYFNRRSRAVAEPAPRLNNYFFSALAGVWYLQFFFYTMGSTQMGEFDFASWTLHMASIIIFSTLWGIALKEWRGTRRAHAPADRGGPDPSHRVDAHRGGREMTSERRRRTELYCGRIVSSGSMGVAGGLLNSYSPDLLL